MQEPWLELHFGCHSQSKLTFSFYISISSAGSPERWPKLAFIRSHISVIWTVALHFTMLLHVAGTINIWIGLKVFILLAEAMIYEFHTFSMNLFLMFEFNCVAEEREAGAPHSSAARAQLSIK